MLGMCLELDEIMFAAKTIDRQRVQINAPRQLIESQQSPCHLRQPQASFHQWQ